MGLRDGPSPGGTFALKTRFRVFVVNTTEAGSILKHALFGRTR